MSRKKLAVTTVVLSTVTVRVSLSPQSFPLTVHPLKAKSSAGSATKLNASPKA